MLRAGYRERVMQSSQGKKGGNVWERGVAAIATAMAIIFGLEW